MTCAETNSDDCVLEHKQMTAVGTFCVRCDDEQAAQPLRLRCKLCCETCNADADDAPNDELEDDNLLTNDELGDDASEESPK